MKFSRRSHEEDMEQGGSIPDGPAGDGLSEIRQAGEDFLKAGDEAINRAMSTNSEAFLAANRQQGGQ
jgi:hypothetical protein